MTYWLTVEEIMVTFNVRRSYVYRLASQHRWRKYRDEERRAHYRADDVAATPGIGSKAA